MKKLILIPTLILLNTITVPKLFEKYDNTPSAQTIVNEKVRSAVLSGEAEIKSVRDYTPTADEVNRYGDLKLRYDLGEAAPSVKMAEKTESDEMYFDTATDTLYLPEREMTDEEMLTEIEFFDGINGILASQQPKPGENDISAGQAEDKAREAAEIFFECDLSGFDSTAAYNKIDDGSLQWDVILKNPSGDTVYHIRVDSRSGEILGIDDLLTQHPVLGYASDSSDQDRKAYAKKAAQLVEQICGERKIKNTMQYIPKCLDDRICTFFETDSGECYEVMTIYPTGENASLNIFANKEEQFLENRISVIIGE